MLLTKLATKDSYAFDMMTEIRESLDLEIPYGYALPILCSLEEKGYITSYGLPQNNRIRNWFHLTDTGQEYFQAQYAELKLLLEEMESVFVVQIK